MAKPLFLNHLWSLLGMQKKFDSLFSEDWLQPIFICNRGAWHAEWSTTEWNEVESGA